MSSFEFTSSMKKITYWFLWVACYSIIVLIPNFSHAECSACSESPAKFQEYIDVMKELINNPIPSTWSTGAVVATKNRYTKAKEVAEQHLRDIVPQIEYAEEEWELKLLEQTKIRSRDYDKLQDLDEKILLKLWEFGIVNEWQSLNGWNMKDQAEIIDSLLRQLKFIQLTKLNDGYALSGITYVEYLWMLWRLNGLMKYLHRDREWFHFELNEVGKWTLKAETKRAQDTLNSVEKQHIFKPFNDLVVLGSSATKSTAKWKNPIDVFTFTDDYKELLLFAWGLQRDYECTLGVRGLCEQRKDTAESSWRQVKDRWKGDSTRAVDTFKSALERFQDSFWWNTDKAKRQEREDERINEYRWENIPRKKKRREFVKVEGEEEEVAWSPISLTRFARNLFEDEKERNARIKREWWKYVWGQRVSSSVSNKPVSPNSDDMWNADTPEEKKALIDAVYVWYYDKRERELWSENRINTQSYYVAWDTQREKLAIQNTMIGVLNLQRWLDTTALANDVSAVTKQFQNLSHALYANSALRWDKHDTLGNDSSIYPSAQSVCNYQCSNITDKQCWATGE